MPRAVIFLIVLILAVGGVLYFLSLQAREVPTRPVEIEVNTSGNAL